MKVTTALAPIEGFRPVSVTLTFESLQELAAVTDLFGGMSYKDIEKRLAGSSDRCERDVDTAFRCEQAIHGALSAAYEGATR